MKKSNALNKIAMLGVAVSFAGVLAPSASAAGIPPSIIVDATTSLSLGKHVALPAATVKTKVTSISTNQKVKDLMAFANQQLGLGISSLALSYDATQAFGIHEEMEIHDAPSGKSAVASNDAFFLPLKGVSKINIGATAVLLWVESKDNPELSFPRLLIRKKDTEWYVDEYSAHRTGKVLFMTAKFGDCVFDTGLRLLKNSKQSVQNSANSVLVQTLTASAKPGHHLIEGLRAVYLPSPTYNAASFLAFTSFGVVAPGNYEEEWTSAVVDTYLSRLKPVIRPINTTEQWLKEQLKNALKEGAKKAVQAILSFLAGLL